MGKFVTNQIRRTQPELSAAFRLVPRFPGNEPKSVWEFRLRRT